MSRAANDDRGGQPPSRWVGTLRAIRARVFARFDADSETWSAGWLRWPTGSGGVLVSGLLLIKLLVTAWNCLVFDGTTYDQGALHVPRARTAGLGTSGRAYNPPLYYLGAAPTVVFHRLTASPVSARADEAPASNDLPDAAKVPDPRTRDDDTDDRDEQDEPDDELAREEDRVDAAIEAEQQATAKKKARRFKDRQLLHALRWTNLGYLALFYVAWIGAILPRLILDRHRAWVAMLLLLALPGYQKLAAMVHPDNALSAVTALGIAAWLVLRDDTRPPGWRVLWVATFAGLVALTRPFGVLPAAALIVACATLVFREHGAWTLRALRRVGACVAIAGALAASWPAYQLATLGRLSPVYKDSYLEPYLPHRPGFDRVGYFASFHLVELLEVPSRQINERDTEHDRFHNEYGNSFWTLLYSETWGDHWLYFSGRYQVENKVWAKRLILAAAIPTIPLLILGFVRGVVASFTAVTRWRRDPDADKAAFLLAFLALGVAMYLYWHLEAGLTPGKNSSVKFIYNAYLYPVGLALCFLAPMSKIEGRLWPNYAAVLFAASIPFIVYLPKWLLT